MTYTAGSTTRLNIVRRLSGDTDTNNERLVDDDINYWLSVQSDNNLCAAECIGQYQATVATKVTETSGRTSKAWSDLYDQLEKRRKLLIANVGKTGVGTGTAALVGYAGGQSKEDKRALRQDADRVQPVYSGGMDDYPGTGRDAGGAYSTRDDE